MWRAIVRLGFVLLLVTGGGLSAGADPADLVGSGVEAVRQDRWDEAVRLLTQAIAARGLSNSDRALAHSSRGYAYFAKGAIGQAIADYTEAIRLAPNDADPHSLRGWAHFTKGSLSQAIADSSAAIRLDPNLVFAYRNRGRAQLYSGRAKAAAEDFAAAVRLLPSDALGVIWLHVARVRSGQNDVDEFSANTAKIDRGEWPGTLLEVVTGGSTPEHVGDVARAATGEKAQGERLCDTQVYFGLLQLAAGDKAEARALFKAAAADCPVGATEATERTVANVELKALGGAPAKPAPAAHDPSGADVAATHHDRGYAYFVQGQFDRAIAEYNSAIRLAPNDGRSHRLRALARFSKGEMNQAIADATAAIRLDPDSAVPLRVRGLAQLYVGLPKAAADDFAAAVRLSPSDALGMIWLHVARMRAGQQDAQELRVNIDRVDRREWPGPLIEVLTGGKTVEQVGDVAMSSADEKTRHERVCEAQVYFGLLQLAASDKAEARKLFHAAVADCPLGAAEAAELAVAKMELKRLGSAPATPSPKRNQSRPVPVAQQGGASR